MRDVKVQKRESEILAQFSQEVECARKNIDAIISIAGRRGLDENSPEYTQIKQLREFFATILDHVQKDSGYTSLIFSVKPAYEKLNAGNSRWPVLMGEYAVAVSYEFYTVLNTILNVGNKLNELPKGSLTLPQSKSLAQYASDKGYSKSINKITTSIANKFFAALKSEELKLDKPKSSDLDEFTCIDDSKLTSKETEILGLMRKLTEEILNQVVGEPRAAFQKIHHSLRAYEKFQSIPHKNVFLEFNERFREEGPVSIAEKMTTVSKMLKNIQPASIEKYLSDSKLPMVFLDEKGVKSTYRHFVVEQENEISKLALDFKKFQAYYLMPVCYFFANQDLLEIQMHGVWPQSLEDKRKVLEKLGAKEDSRSEFKNSSQKFLDAISVHMDRSEAESHIEFGYLRANQQAQEILMKEIGVLVQENALNFLKNEEALIHEFLLRQEFIVEKIDGLFKNNAPREDLISTIASLKSEVSQHENQRKRLSQNEDATWRSMLKDPEFFKQYEAYQKAQSALESCPHLEPKADDLNQLLLNNLDEVIAANENAISSIKKTLKTFNRSYGEYEAQKNQEITPNKSVSQHYQTRSRIAKNHALKVIPFEAYRETHSNLLATIEQEVSQRKEQLVRELGQLHHQQSKWLEEKKSIEFTLESAHVEKRELLKLEAESSYAKVALTYLAGFVSDSFSKVKQTQVELDKKMHSLNLNLADINDKLKENAGFIDAKKEYQQEFEQDSVHLLSMDRIVIDVTKDRIDIHRLELKTKETEFLGKFERLYVDIKRPFLKGETLDETCQEVKRLQNTLEKENEYFLLKQHEHKAEVLLKEKIKDSQQKFELSLKGKISNIQQKVDALVSQIALELETFNERGIDAIIFRIENSSNIASIEAYISARETHLYKLGVMLSDEISGIRESLQEARHDAQNVEMHLPVIEEHSQSILNQLDECKKAISEDSGKWQEIKRKEFLRPDREVVFAHHADKRLQVNYLKKPRTGFQNQIFTNCQFSPLSYSRADLRNAVFINCYFQDVLVGEKDSRFKDVILDNATRLDFNQYGGKIVLHNAHLPGASFSDLFALISRDELGAQKYHANASDILAILREIGSLDISLPEKKTRAKEVMNLMLPAITDLSELLKFKALVDTKHHGAENPYGYIREERHTFRAKYGNTETWNHILGAIQLKLQEKASENTPITDAQYREYYDIMKTRRSHTYGLGGMFQNLGGNAAEWKDPAGKLDLDLAFDRAAADHLELGQYKK